jgi:DNA recombination protein RmuC
MELLFIIVGILIGFFAGYFFAKKDTKSQFENLDQIKQEMETTFKALAADVNKSNTEDFFKLANDKFQNLSKESDKNLDQKKELIDKNLEEMSKKLDSIQKQSTELNVNIEQNKVETKNLRNTTTKLREILSSSQKRGQWGESMVDDILQFLGLIENINYKRQLQVESGERPDYTFFLPRSKKINMDVKFPLSNYKKYIESDDENIKEISKKDFLKDIKNHIKTITNRAYINPGEGTVDYVLMFIPNESIYSFINKEDQDIINHALSNKVLLCSPLTLYAILALMHQATRNFAMEQKAHEVLALLESFKTQWDEYIKVFDKMGRSIQAAQNDYEKLSTTRRKKLEKPLNEIEKITDDIILDTGDE